MQSIYCQSEFSRAWYHRPTHLSQMSMGELIPPLLDNNSCFHPWGEFASKVVDRNVGCRHAWNAYIKSAVNMPHRQGALDCSYRGQKRFLDE